MPETGVRSGSQDSEGGPGMAEGPSQRLLGRKALGSYVSGGMRWRSCG